jgi:hypothetical protein
MSPRTRVRRFARTVSLLALAVLLPGCNLWEWTADSESYDALVADGRQAIRDADYDLAVSLLSEAVEKEPARGQARYYLAKAAVLQADIDVIELVDTVTEDPANGGGAEAIFHFEINRADRIYRVNEVVADALEPIRDGTASSDGLAVIDIDLDLAVAYTLRGILRLRDTNGDGRIDANDVPIEQFDIDLGDEYSLEGIVNVPPDDLNDMLDDLNDLLASGGDLALGGLGDGGIDTDELNDIIDQLGGDLSAFYVNTGVPGNPGEGDNDGDGTADEECLNDLDDDGDGLVDEDARVLGCP